MLFIHFFIVWLWLIHRTMSSIGTNFFLVNTIILMPRTVTAHAFGLKAIAHQVHKLM
jgi:hypothetical protein